MNEPVHAIVLVWSAEYKLTLVRKPLYKAEKAAIPQELGSSVSKYGN